MDANPGASDVEKLAKIFRLLLSATSPGEVVAARDAMLSLINGHKMDLHDLAAVLVKGFNPPVLYKPPSIEEPACDVAAWCLYQFERNGIRPRDAREHQFIRDMARRWGPPSEKQKKWLAAIHNRLVRDAA
jgi:hypothetical protein